MVDAGPDCYLSLGQELMGLLKNWVGIGVRKVINSVKVLIMCCGSVRYIIVVVELTFC